MKKVLEKVEELQKKNREARDDLNIPALKRGTDGEDNKEKEESES